MVVILFLLQMLSKIVNSGGRNSQIFYIFFFLKSRFINNYSLRFSIF